MNKKALLSSINTPNDLKAVQKDSLPALCGEIREFLIENVTETGGHLASNLGVVELTVALHRVFDFPKDHLIFDVGHQCYTHKLITGRRELFGSLRKRGGLSGFTKMSESEYDCFGAGHSSTSVSAAIGFAEAERLRGSDVYTVAVLGDGAFTGGMVHEALNNCRKDLKLIIILNENEMSISKNIGSFAKLFSKIRASKGYYKTKRKTARFIKRLPFVGNRLFDVIKNGKQSLKDKIYKSNYFEDLGLYYLGPTDGNDLEKTERLLLEARAANQSTVIHLRTVKGKGYSPAENNPGKYHSIPPRGTENKENFSRRAGKVLTELAKNDKRICAVTAAMSEGTGMSFFEKNIPERFFDVGIAEEHALTFSAGLAANGMKPYFAVYSSFLQRGYDNIIHDIALQNLPVTLLIDRAGISQGDGATHHGIFDVSFLSEIPNIEIYTPSDFASLETALKSSVKLTSPVAIRYQNGGDTVTVSEKFERIDSDILKYFSSNFPENIIITYGRILEEAVSACEIFNGREDSQCGIILLEKLSPYRDVSEKINMAISQNVKKVIFIEEGIKNGSAGMIFRELLQLPTGCRYVHMAIDSVFDTELSTGSIYRDFGIGCEDILKELNE